MTGLTLWKRRVRWWAAGLAFGASALGGGCRSSAPPADPPARYDLPPYLRARQNDPSAPLNTLTQALPTRGAGPVQPVGGAAAPRPEAVWAGGVSAGAMKDPPAPAGAVWAGGVSAGRPNRPPGATTPPPTGAVWAGGVSAAGAQAPAAKLPTVPDPALPQPAVPAADAETIDLSIALRLGGVGNPTINLAREQVREALAAQLGARSLLLPTINVGGNYHLHNGVLQPSFGGTRVVDSSSLYMGLGARTLAAESVAFPGIRLFAHLGDAVFEPLAARQRVAARQSDRQAVQNDMLLRISVAYLELVGAEARLEVMRQGQVDAEEVVKATRAFAARGQGRQADTDRASARSELLRQNVRRAEEAVAVSSARLCELLNLDPSVRLRSPGGAVLPVRLIPEEAPDEALVAQGLRSRPELLARSAEIQEAQMRVRQERVRPWVPLLSVGFSGGVFGGGSNLVAPPRFGDLFGRTDFDVFAVWTHQNLGVGNRALVRRADAVVGQSLAAYQEAFNTVRREVSEALADARAAARKIELAQTSVVTAREEFRLETQRTRQGEGLPIESLDSFEQLLESRQELVRAVVEFDIAQFRLYVAVGSSPPSVPVVGPEGAAEAPPKP